MSATTFAARNAHRPAGGTLTMRYRLCTATATHAGKIRGFNDDSLAQDASLGVFVVADGMGGHHAGDVAAETAARVVLERLSRGAEIGRAHV